MAHKDDSFDPTAVVLSSLTTSQRHKLDVRAGHVRSALADRMHHDIEMERKILRNELAKIGRSRLERMLGPEGGYHNW